MNGLMEALPIDAVMPELQQGLQRFATVAATYSDAAPHLIEALNNFRTTNATIIDRIIGTWWNQMSSRLAGLIVIVE